MRVQKSIIYKIGIVMAIVVAALMLFFMLGRYGWKVAGFSACQGAGIESVEVTRNSVRIVGVDPASFPEGFCGYYSEEREGTLYVGFRFSAVFGFFETGDFDITIPVWGEIYEVILKTGSNEFPLWKADPS